MLKKMFAALMLTLALSAVAPVANAEMDLPTCYPCGVR